MDELINYFSVNAWRDNNDGSFVRGRSDGRYMIIKIDLDSATAQSVIYGRHHATIVPPSNWLTAKYMLQYAQMFDAGD